MKQPGFAERDIYRGPVLYAGVKHDPPKPLISDD